jgi:sulfoxide reductase catalytic subunit YedY
MLIKTPQRSHLNESDITDEAVYRDRRSLLKGMGFLGVGTLMSAAVSKNATAGFFSNDDTPVFKTQPLNYKQDTTNEGLIKTPEQKIISHNNFYEFGAKKEQPAELSQGFKVDPWKLTISGECDNPITLDYDDLTKMFPLEERIYRLRCVEAWSMVVPWVGISLGEVLKKFKPNSKAKYVYFETLHDPSQFPGQNGGNIQWPYREGLRIDEAMNDLAFLSVGMYGSVLPNQNGAPVRLVVPWKYGFKSIKSIVKIRFVETMPETTWNLLAPQEYGFYANVNPGVDHPRWTQKQERRLPGGLLFPNVIDTQMFNGYKEEVAGLYSGMSLVKNY